MPEVNIKVEVKQDYKSHYTGNFMFEYLTYGKPSGLSVTTSDWWVQVDRYYLYFINTEVLKMLCDNLNHHIDEESNSNYVVVKKDLFEIQPTVKIIERVPDEKNYE